MPTLLREDGFRLFFYANEGKEPPHIHIEHQGLTAKFWLNPVRFASNEGLSGKNLSRAAEVIRKHEKLIEEKWRGFFSKKI